MSAPTFETLSAELTQALSRRRDIPPKATARCTLGRDKVMVLVEYPSQESDSKKLATRTLDWLEQRLRQEFDITGLPIEIADLSETTEEVAVQLYLKHLSASKPFTMRSFTWRVEDGFADLFGQPDFGSLETDSPRADSLRADSLRADSPEANDLKFDDLEAEDLEAGQPDAFRSSRQPLEQGATLTSDSKTTATTTITDGSADSATDLYADLSEGISQPAQRADDDLMEFLVPGEAPVVASSELDLPTVDLPVTSRPTDDRASDFFDLDTEQQSAEAIAEPFDLAPSLESDDIVTDDELVDEALIDEALSSDALDALFATDETSEVELVAPVLEEPVLEEPVFEEPLPAASALEESALEDLTLRDTAPEVLTPEDLTLEGVLPEEPVVEGITPEELALEQLALEELALEELESEALQTETPTLAEPALEDSTSEELAIEELMSEEELTSEESAPEDTLLEGARSEDTALEEPASETKAKEFVLDDLGPEALASQELTFKETPVEEPPADFESDEPGELPNVYAVIANSPNAYADADASTEAYEDESYTAEAYEEDYDSYEDREDEDSKTYEDFDTYEDYEDEAYVDEEDLEADSLYYLEGDYSEGDYSEGDYLEGDRTDSDSQTDEDIAPIDEQEVQWQREQWAQQSKRSPWVFVGLFGFLVAGVLGFVLTRPCTFGQCDRLETARIESDEALDQLRIDDSADNIEAAQQKLRRSISRLEAIPVWSSYRDEASTAIPAYERQLTALDLVSEAQSKAYSAAVQSQDPPHSVSTWKAIAAQWREATAALSAVPGDSPVYDFAQTKLLEYRANLSTILVRVETESRAEVSLRQAQQSASQATQQAKVASSVEAWEAAADGWETAVENLQQIPQTTQAYTEAQQMLPEYEQNLREARDRAQTERSASDRLSAAKQKAAEAQRAESESLWTLALDSWNTALVDLESVDENTSAHTEAEVLLAQYTKSWNEAGKNQETSLRFQTVEPSFFLMCGVSSVQLCTYAVKSGGVRVDLFAGYDQVIDQSITPPDQRVETVADEQLVAQGNQLLQQITLLSKQAQIPVVLHDSSGQFLARYRPELDGFVRQ